MVLGKVQPAEVPAPRIEERRLPHSPSSDWRWRPILTSNVVLGCVLSALGWPITRSDLLVTGGVDQSWRAAMTMGVHNGIPFGSRMIFTYGPLSFLASPEVFYRWTSGLALVFAFVFSATIFGTFVWAFRRTLPLPVAVIAAYVVGGLSRASVSFFGTNVALEEVLALVLIACVLVLSAPDTRRVQPWSWVGLGGVVGTFTLVKISLGLGTAVALLITICCLPRNRLTAATWTAGGAVVSFLAGWMGTGNSLGSLGAFVQSSFAIVSGYSAAMSAEDPGRWYSYLFALLVVTAIAALAIGHCGGMPVRPKVGVFLVTGFTLWMLFKESFVRHDRHDVAFFVAAPLIMVAFSPRWRFKARSLAAVVPMIIITPLIAGSVPAVAASPVASVGNLMHEVAVLSSSQRTSALLNDSRSRLRARYAIPRAILTSIRGNTVDISPWEQTVAWAYPGMRFDPMPVIQDYSAYTPYLDSVDARFVASPIAPRFVLRQQGPALYQFGEPPAAQLAILCRYRLGAADAQWQLLRRGTDGCGRPHFIETVHAKPRETVVVPAVSPGHVLLATFRLRTSPLAAAFSLVYKPSPIYLVVNDGPYAWQWRFIAATGPDLHALGPPSLFGLKDLLDVRTLRVGARDVRGSSTGFTVSFYDEPIK